MCIIKKFDKENLKEGDYIFIISNIILSQKVEFTYSDILGKVGKFLSIQHINTKLENLVKDCLIRLRENGFLSSLGSFYTVSW